MGRFVESLRRLLPESDFLRVKHSGRIVPAHLRPLKDGSGTVMDVDPRDISAFSNLAPDWYTARLRCLVDTWEPGIGYRSKRVLELGAGTMSRTLFSPLKGSTSPAAVNESEWWNPSHVNASIFALDLHKPDDFDESVAELQQTYPGLTAEYTDGVDLNTLSPVPILRELMQYFRLNDIERLLRSLRESGLQSADQRWPSGQIDHVGFEGVGDYLRPYTNASILLLIAHVIRPETATIRWVFNGQFEQEVMTLEQQLEFEASILQAEKHAKYLEVQDGETSAETIKPFIWLARSTIVPKKLTGKYRREHNLSPSYYGSYPKFDLMAEAMMAMGYKPSIEYVAYSYAKDPENGGYFSSNISSVIMTLDRVHR